MKDRNLFHLVNTIGNIFTSGAATTRENITDVVHDGNIFTSGAATTRENITDGVHEMK